MAKEKSSATPPRRKKALVEQKQLVLVASRILTGGRTESPRNKSLKLLEEIGKVTSMLVELHQRAIAKVEDLHQKYARLKVEVLSLHDRWDEHTKEIHDHLEKIIESCSMASYIEGHRDAKAGKANKHHSSMGI